LLLFYLLSNQSNTKLKYILMLPMIISKKVLMTTTTSKLQSHLKILKNLHLNAIQGIEIKMILIGNIKISLICQKKEIKKNTSINRQEKRQKLIKKLSSLPNFKVFICILRKVYQRVSLKKGANDRIISK
jgi:hypothetical protein